ARAVQRPALVVTGEHDLTCPVAMGLEMARLLRTNLVVIPEIGHMPMLESPDAVAALLESHWAQAER
ncbi:MAG: alpha/beta fold hydrolase, partial [Candidatus Binatia bacterium]